MTDPRPMLTFKMRLPEKIEEKLILGRLYLQHENKVQQEFICTSGLARWQFRNAQLIKGKGPIPANVRKTDELYLVSTTPMRMVDPGHASSKFYAISPRIMQMGNITRGDFGIHHDLNAPGTAGCLGISDNMQWINFVEAMERLRENHLHDLPLRVAYH